MNVCVCMFACVSVFDELCVCAFKLCVCVCMYVCVCVCVCVQNICVCLCQVIYVSVMVFYVLLVFNSDFDLLNVIAFEILIILVYKKKHTHKNTILTGYDCEFILNNVVYRSNTQYLTEK